MLSHVCLEEDACREVSDVGHTITFRTDRLSMPLLEVITRPELTTPHEAREVNALIGRMLKASGLVRRGLGSVRQDVNVSITGGSRVEIKGIPKTGYVDKLTENEAYRQWHLLEIKKELVERGLSKAALAPVKQDVTSLLEGCRSSTISSALDSGARLGAARLTGFAGILRREIQPGRTFADEFAGRVKVIACLDKMPNIAVSELPMPELGAQCWEKLRRHLESSDNDVIVVTWGPRDDVETALNEIVIRAEEAFDGVPNETRQHLGDYTTGFERILPGPDRMYPDTDSPPAAISSVRIQNLEKDLPTRAWEYEERWKVLGVPEGVARKAVVTPLVTLFDSLMSDGINRPEKVFTLLMKSYTRNKAVSSYDASLLAGMFKAADEGLLGPRELESLLAEVPSDRLGSEFDDLTRGRYRLSDEAVQQAVAEVVKVAAKVKPSEDEINYLTGLAIRKLGPGASGKRIKSLVLSSLEGQPAKI